MPRRLTVPLLAALLLAACGGNDRPTEPPPGSFTTEILADGTKLFTYTLDQRPAGRSGNMGPAGERRAENAPRAGGARLPDPHKGLQALLEQNRYCRGGYVTLEQYRMGLRQVVRGECRDGADARDRERFGRGKAGR